MRMCSCRATGPAALAALGFGAEALARAPAPASSCVSLSAYGQGPWAGRRGFDSLVQTATGFNLAEAEAFGAGRRGRCRCRSSTTPPAT